MSEGGVIPAVEGLKEVMDRNPHLKSYVQEHHRKTSSIPAFHQELSNDLRTDDVDLIYPVGDPIFIHIHGIPGKGIRYYNIEPVLTDKEREKYDAIRLAILDRAANEDFENFSGSMEDLGKLVSQLYDEVVSNKGTGIMGRLKSSGVKVNKEEYNKYKYFILRNVVQHNVIEPLIRDPYIEDIHSIGTGDISIVHKVFKEVRTNIHFEDTIKLDKFLSQMSERIGNPVNDGNPIVDAVLPDGSRINIIYSPDVSQKGSSFTIRKFTSVPLTITQLSKWGSVSPMVGAYLWLCIEQGLNIFVCGETASGKTTLLNAALPFVDASKKIYSSEDTPEVLPPQHTWQRCVTRESGPEDARVTSFDLLKAALRSRPDYIIVGEIRGLEGAVAFQAMQTGIPVMATFHAANTRKLIQRFTGHPINVPLPFMDNLNVVVFQSAIYVKGKFLRRCTHVDEIVGYSRQKGGIITKTVFEWNPAHDVHVFRGLNNSFILEEKIAVPRGYKDKREIYQELKLRAKIIQKMIDLNITGYNEVNQVYADYRLGGLSNLSFDV